MFVYISPDWKEMQELQTQTQETGEIKKIAYYNLYNNLSHLLVAQFIHLREVPDGCPSQGGRVHHQDHLPLVFRHGDFSTIQLLGRKFVEM